MACRNTANATSCSGPCYWQDTACTYKCSGTATWLTSPRGFCTKAATNDGFCCTLQPEEVLVELAALQRMVQRDQTAAAALALLDTTLREAVQDATPATRAIVQDMGRDFLEQAQVRVARIIEASPAWLDQRQLAVRARESGAMKTSSSSDLGPIEDALDVMTRLRRTPPASCVLPPAMGSILDDTTAFVRSRLPPADYQVVAARHLLYNRGVIVAHEVGLGKTLTAILAAEMLLQNNLVDRVVVVTPSFLISNFHDALRRDYGLRNTERYELFSHRQFYGQYSKYISTTLPDENSLDDNDDDAMETLLTETVSAAPSRLRIYMQGLIQRLSTDMARVCLIVDEAHAFRTTLDLVGEGKGRMAFIMMQAARFATRVVCMTATPMCNGPADICNLVAMVRGDAWPKTTEFNSMLDSYQNEAALNMERAEAHLLAFAQAYCANVFSFARVIKEPPNTLSYPNVKEEDFIIQIQGAAAALLRSVRNKDPDVLARLRLPANPFPFSAGLRQAMNSIYEFTTGEQTGFSLKASRIANVLDPVKNTPAGRAIIFTQWLRNGVDRIEAVLRSRGIQFVSITGQTPKGTRVIHKRLFDQEQVQVLILSAAASEGLSFKNVRHVFLMEKAWNSAREQQAIGRATRLYSHRSLPNEADRQVTVYHVMLANTEYETTDIRMRALAQQKDKAIAIVQRVLNRISIPTPPTNLSILLPARTAASMQVGIVPVMRSPSVISSSGLRGTMVTQDAFANRVGSVPGMRSVRPVVTPAQTAGGSQVARMGTAPRPNTTAIAAALRQNNMV